MLGEVICFRCGKIFLKQNRHINENKKLSHKFYCSTKCQSLFKNQQKVIVCENPKCRNRFTRKLRLISLHNFCSRSCSTSVNNSRHPKRLKVVKHCAYCKNPIITWGRKYCSLLCRDKNIAISEEEIISRIKNFFALYKRIPLKSEFKHNKTARKRFGTWNNAILAAGFLPNPVLFAKRQVALDGHMCDSLAEKIIDDFLSQRNIIHKRNYPYPEGTYTADFKIGESIVEFFGLSGEHKRYDQLKYLKKQIAKKYSINLIEIYPKDLFPKNNLANFLLNSSDMRS
jgi:hypothetical protein